MTYVLSDIHGNLRRFESIMAQINLQPDDTLYVLGDVIDRYPDGIKILRRIMQMPNAKMLIGNHEYMMLKAIGHCKDVAEEKENTNWRQRKIWYRNGGMVTHEQLKHYRKDIRAEIFNFIRQLPDYSLDRPVTRKEFAVLMDAVVDPFHAREIDITGKFI